MCEFEIELVVGRKYKVRLKPLEELLKEYPEVDLFTDDGGCWDVDSPYHTTNSQGEGLYNWYSRYMDGGLGYATFDGNTQNSGVWVKWDKDGDAWYYEWDALKVLGEV